MRKGKLHDELRLQQYVHGVSSPLVVLQNFPSVDSQAHAFIAARVAMAVVAEETLEETLQTCSTDSSLAETIQFVAISDLTYDISTITLPDASTVQSTVRAVWFLEPRDKSWKHGQVGSFQEAFGAPKVVLDIECLGHWRQLPFIASIQK